MIHSRDGHNARFVIYCIQIMIVCVRERLSSKYILITKPNSSYTLGEK